MIIRLFFAFLITGLTCFVQSVGKAQSHPATLKFIDADFGLGNSEGSLALSFNYDHGFGKNKKIVVGFG
jgi:hypothetical protein